LEKLKLCGYPIVKKVEDMITRFDTIYKRDGRTDIQMHDGIGRTYS